MRVFLAGVLDYLSGLCDTWAMRNSKGQFLGGSNHPNYRPPDIPITDTDAQRLWSKVLIGKAEDCWPWQGYRGEKGYGQMGFNRKLIAPHRLAYMIAHDLDDLPTEVCVLHKCDNPPCCNPRHLFLGDKNLNNEDMRQKGRGKHEHLFQWVGKGVDHHAAVLNEKKVLEIRHRRADGEANGMLAAEFGVTPGTICAIVYKRLWAHVGGPTLVPRKRGCL